MLSVMVATMLAMAAKDPLEGPRKTYSNCLIELHNDAIKAKKTTDEFKSIAEAGCEKERTAFRDAVKKGEKPADANDRADEEVTWVIEWIVDTYTGNLEDGTTISK